MARADGGGLTIDRQRVSYRGLSVPTAHVVEVTGANEIYIFTTRRALAVPQGFCDPRFNRQPIDELRRVIAARGRPM